MFLFVNGVENTKKCGEKCRSQTKAVCVVGLLQSFIVSRELSLDDGQEKYPDSTKIRNPMKQATTAETV